MSDLPEPARSPAEEMILPANRRVAVLALLTAVYALAFVDRQILNIIAEPLKRDLDLADWQVGALAGPAFVVCYTLAGVPLARIAERWNRPRLLAMAVAVWSGFTALSGQASGFLGLVVARMGVGTAEAACVPAAQSFIADITPRERRATALAIFSLGLPLGSLIGLSAGGVLAHHYDWRTAFMLVGLPGLALATLLLLVRDPRSTVALAGPTAQAPVDGDMAVPSLRQTLRDLRAQPSFIWMTVGATVLALAGYGHATFYASFFLRTHATELAGLAAAWGMGDLAFLGLALGLALGISGLMGTSLGGFMADRLASRGFRNYLLVPIWATAAGMPLTIAALLVPGVLASLGLLAFAAVFKSMWFGPMFATIQGLVGARSRATAVSVFLLVMNGIGMGAGPLLMGGLSDALAAATDPAAGLRIAMALTAGLVLIAAWCFARARGSIAGDAPGERAH